MRGALLALECRGVDLAAGGDLGGDGLDRAVAQGSGRFGGLVEKGNELGRGRSSAWPRDGFDGSQSVRLMQNP